MASGRWFLDGWAAATSSLPRHALSTSSAPSFFARSNPASWWRYRRERSPATFPSSRQARVRAFSNTFTFRAPTAFSAAARSTDTRPQDRRRARAGSAGRGRSGLPHSGQRNAGRDRILAGKQEFPTLSASFATSTSAEPSSSQAREFATSGCVSSSMSIER